MGSPDFSIFTYLVERRRKRRSSFSNEMYDSTPWQLRNRMEAKKAVKNMTVEELVAKARRDYEDDGDIMDEAHDGEATEEPEED